MAIGEFSLIEKYFHRLGASVEGVELGVGDDCALLEVPEGHRLAVTTDTLLDGVHFPSGAPADLVAYRALCTNLSDLAAMGAEPRWFQLALSLPEADEAWLTPFSRGLAEAARQYQCRLVGGDTVRGPLAVTITMMGVVPGGEALLRSGARVGDGVYVSGTLGDARAALDRDMSSLLNFNESDYLLHRFWRPQPRVNLATGLRGVASAAIDLSDGLLADLGHIVRASGVGAEIQLDLLPVSPQAVAVSGADAARRQALSGGDDYELCFTVPDTRSEILESLAGDTGVPVTRIGRVTAGTGVQCIDASGMPVTSQLEGYVHF